VRVDYDAIAHLYDEPLRDHVVDAQLMEFLRARSESTPARILDVGCGTGKQLTADHHHLPALRLVGVDRFAGMLRIAKRRGPGVDWLQADGAELPLKAQSVDYATCQYAYPHIGRPERVITEVFRVLRSGGRFVMTNIDPWAMPGWLLYRFFPEAYDLDRRDFVEVDRFVALMQAAGFTEICVTRQDKSVDQTLPDFLAYASERHRTSHLLAMADNAYAAGVRRLQEAVAADDGRAQRSEFALVTIAGEKHT
jgi:SAM-dependent methyltransferase